MEARRKLDPLWVPQGLAPERGLRWCIGRSLSDLRASAARGKTMTLANVHRLFLRRWSRVAEQCEPRPSDGDQQRSIRLGLREIEMFYRLRHPFVRSDAITKSSAPFEQGGLAAPLENAGFAGRQM